MARIQKVTSSRTIYLLLLLLLLSPLPLTASDVGPQPIAWQPWSDGVFAQARQQHKFVLLDLEAVWCHWCHVMDDITYRDPAVQRLIAAKYIAVKVDQDARPDLSNRYEDYGWPATVVFAANGSEIVKRQGYLPPRPMASMLQAIIDDPSPGPSVEPETHFAYSNSTAFSLTVLSELKANFNAQYDQPNAGWGFSHKYLDADSVEYASTLARRGDTVEAKRVRDTLQQEQKLLDPVWGGAYQYSVGGKWDEPHFEKLISIQAQVMRAYALASIQWHDATYLSSAENVHRYIRSFLTSPFGAFYVSQDADLVDGQHSADYFALSDAARRKQGIPRVDTHVYARENGWMIHSLCALYAASGNAQTLDEAGRAARWIAIHRALPGGGFRHGDHDIAGPYMGDTLSMGQAFLSLYAITGDRHWLTAAEAARGFITANFSSHTNAGFVTTKKPTDNAYQPHPERDENAQFARFANLLYQYTGNRADKDAGDIAMRYLATREIALRPLAGGVLLAEAEYATAPAHITVIGSHTAPAAKALFQAALCNEPAYDRLEWWDPARGPMLRADIQYPQLGRPAAFLCTANACSSPIFDPQTLATRIRTARF